MLNLPSWAKPFLIDKPCPYCQQNRVIENVIGVGIREIVEHSTDNEGKYKIGLFFEYLCDNCEKSSFTIVDPDEYGTTDVKMINEIKNAISKKGGKNRSVIHKSVITKKDLDDFSNMIQSVNNHEEFMKNIGIEEEMINKYRYKGKINDRKKNGKSKKKK